MTLTHRPYVGHEVRCDARGCNATTATAGRRWVRTPQTATAAAHALGWLEIVIAGEPKWVCPLHQTWDPRLGRWVATPLVTR